MFLIKWANVILGTWLILSPFVLGFKSETAIWNNILVGFFVLVFAFIIKVSEIQSERHI